MKNLFSLIFILAGTFAFGQSKASKEINNQVWKPFIQAFAENDSMLYRSIHSTDMVRVSGESVQGFDSYMRGYGRMFSSMKSRGEYHKIEFTFKRLLSDDTRAFEEGFYKVTRVTSAGERTFYGKFDVVLKKENGQWKILVDSDVPADEKMFNEGKKLKEQ